MNFWEPFRRWRDLLRQPKSKDKHRLITFNYDRVLKMLDFGDWVLLPSQGATLADYVLKLHGSVDWKRCGEGFDRHEDVHFAARCTDAELSIAPPGPAKAAMTEKIEPLWKIAEQRLAEANTVCFIGYRFPPTDSTARRRILHAMPSDFAASVHVVLGPDTHHDDVVRLKGLLSSRIAEQRVRIHPMWAQDFLSVFEPHLLTPS